MPEIRPAAEWLVGSSEIVELIRRKDWSQTQLGAIETWPESLQTTVWLCLASSFPINLAWGKPICNSRTSVPPAATSVADICSS